MIERSSDERNSLENVEARANFEKYILYKRMQENGKKCKKVKMLTEKSDEEEEG